MVVVIAVSVVILTAGAATPLVLASVASGTALMPGMTALTTICAVVVVFGGTALAACAVVASGASAQTLYQTGDWNSAINTFANYGSTALMTMGYSIAYGIINGYSAYQQSKAWQQSINEQIKLEKQIQSARSTASTEAKKEELEYLKLQKEYYDKNGKLPNGLTDTQWGTARNITKEQAMHIIETREWTFVLNGQKFQFDGHHIKSVDFAKGQGDFGSIKDPNNMAIGNRWTNHFYDWHGGNWATHTDHIVIGNRIVTTIDRKALIEQIQRLLGG